MHREKVYISFVAVFSFCVVNESESLWSEKEKNAVKKTNINKPAILKLEIDCPDA